MNRKSFMAELRSLLAFLDAAERERVLNLYERMFDEAGPPLPLVQAVFGDV